MALHGHNQILQPRDRNRNRPQAKAMVPVRGFGDAPRFKGKLVLDKSVRGVPDEGSGPSTKPTLFGIDFDDVFDFAVDVFGDDLVDAVLGTGPERGGGGGRGSRGGNGREQVFTDNRGGGTGFRVDPRTEVSDLDNFTGGDLDFGDEVAEILAELGFGPSQGIREVSQVEGEEPEFGGPVSGLFTDLDANQLEDSAGRPLVVNPGIEQRIKCPRGYVAVEIDDEGTRVCMLKGAAIAQGHYKRRHRPPISASEWRILKSSGRTAKKVEVVLGKAGAAVGKKLVSKSARATRTRPRTAIAAAAPLMLPARSDDDSVIINT